MSMRSVPVFFTCAFALAWASQFEGDVDDDSSNSTPTGFRIMIPRGKHIETLIYSSERTPSVTWDGKARAVEVGIQLTNRFGLDLKREDFSMDDDVLTGSAYLSGVGSEKTRLADFHCTGQVMCVLSLTALQVEGNYTIDVEPFAISKWAGSDKKLPPQRLNLELKHSRAAGKLRFTNVPPYMLANSRYGLEVALFDKDGSSLKGVLTPWEGQAVIVEAWLARSHRSVAVAHVRNSTAVFSGVYINLAETQSLMLVSRMAGFQDQSPTSMTVHSCPAGHLGRMVNPTPTLLPHGRGFEVKVLLPRPIARPLHLPPMYCQLDSPSNPDIIPSNKRILGRQMGTSQSALIIGNEADPCTILCQFPKHSLLLPVVKFNLSVVQPIQVVNQKNVLYHHQINVTQLGFNV